MESAVKDNDAGKMERTSRSTTRTAGRPRKSPSRISPSRKQSGRQSPSRRSPARRSPGRSPSSRTRKLAPRSMRIAQVVIPSMDIAKSEARIESSKTEVEGSKETDDVTELIPLQSRMRKPITAVTRRSTRILSNVLKPNHEERLITMTRSVDRAASLPVDRRTHLYDIGPDQKERGLSMQRDHREVKILQDLDKNLYYEAEFVPDPQVIEKSKKEIELISKPQEWGGWLGALCLVFLLPIAILLPQIACFDNQCSSGEFRVPTKWRTYLSLDAIALYSGFLVTLGVASMLPIGRLIDGQQNKIGRLQYRINGLPSAFLAIAALGFCEYRTHRASDFILDSCLQLSVAGWLIGTVLAVGLYVKGGRVSVSSLNMHASTNNIIYDFWQGREVNPRLGPLDFKVLLIRAGLIASLAINSAVIVKSLQDAESLSTKDLNPTVLVATALQILYCLDSLVFEAASLTSFRTMYEGTGYMVCVGNLLFPFLMTLGTRYLLYQKVQQSNYMLAGVVLVFFVGYVIYRRSNSLKDQFRKNPFSPVFSHLETIPTSRGKKIITSGLWGHVRHPNYLGDIIIHWSMAILALRKDFLPYYAAICCTLALMYRAIRDNTRCRNRYGSAWEQYCLRVKSMIFKRVF